MADIYHKHYLLIYEESNLTFNCVVHKLALKAILRQHFKNILGNRNKIKININIPKGLL